jgi:predicted porin
VSNAGGAHLWAANSGRRSPDRFGFRGVEDLGGGLSAMFRLESGFNSDTGALTRPDTFFNRYTQLGLQHRTLGSLTLGHMPDFMYEYVAPTSNSVPGLSAAFSPGNLDNLANQFQLDNAVKYESPELGGFQAGAMYGFGEVANSGSTNERYSAGAQYRNQALRVAAAYSMFHNRSADVRGLFGLTSLLGQTLPAGATFSALRFRTEGLGASYKIGRFTPHVLVTDVSLGNTVGSESLRNYQAGVNVDAFGNLGLVGLSYARSTFADRRYDQVNLFASYFLSKRTQVYAGLNHVKGKDAATTAGVFGYAKSSTDSQSVFRVGIQNQF